MIKLFAQTNNLIFPHEPYVCSPSVQQLKYIVARSGFESLISSYERRRARPDYPILRNIIGLSRAFPKMLEFIITINFVAKPRLELGV